MWFYEESIFVPNLHVKNLTWELMWDSNVRSHVRSNMRFMLVHFGIRESDMISETSYPLLPSCHMPEIAQMKVKIRNQPANLASLSMGR